MKKEYNKDFKDLVAQCVKNEQYVGLGNPNAQILFVGKEAGIDPTVTEEMNKYKENAIIWHSGDSIYSEPFKPQEGSGLLNHGHTWQKYQKLHNIIFEKEMSEDYYIDFVQNVFTTELSNLPYENTNGAKQQDQFKYELEKRKREFFDNKYFKSRFPIVLILALDGRYISNHGTGETREIDNIFDVEYKKLVECTRSVDKFWVHYGKDENKPRLLIHARQLTNGASNELLEKIGEEIKAFCKDHSIDIRPS